MKPQLFLLLFLTCAAAADDKRVVPPIQIQCKNLPALASPMRVTMHARKLFSTSFKDQQTIQLDDKGQGRFDGRTIDKLDWLAFRFNWTPKGRPEREILYQVRIKKGGKVPGGRAASFHGDEASYVFDGEQLGDCDNLLSYEAKDGQVHILFQVPATFLECKDSGSKIDDVSQVGVRDLNKGKLNYYPFADDERLGKQFADELATGKDNPPLNDKKVQSYVDDLVRRIGKASDMPDLQFRAQVIDADVLNAFAVPGGYIWVYRGLIENTESEAELAGVIAHEIAHVTSRHGTEGMTSAINKTTFGQAASQALSNTTDKGWLKQAIQTAVLGGTNFWVVGGTRKSEAEADKLGAQYAYRAGYDPMGIATLFGRWAANKPKGGRLEKYFSDHPADEDRVKAVTRDVSYFLPPKEGLIVSSDAYKQVKAHLKTLPRPKQSGEVAGNALFSSFKKINESLIEKEVEAYIIANQPKPKETAPAPDKNK